MRRWATGWVVALVAGLLLLGGAVVYHEVMAGRIEERVVAGRAVPATVAEVRLARGLPDRVVVRYTVGSRTYRTTLTALFTAPQYAAGERVTAYTDRADPTRVATAEGYTSESWWLLAPPLPMGSAGAVIAVVAAGQPVRRWWEARGERDPTVGDPTGPVLPTDTATGSGGGAEWRRPARRPDGTVRFDTVRGGYDVQDVQTFVRWFERVLTSHDPQEWERARTALRLTTFHTRFRGYHRQQVNDHIATLADRLRRVTGES